MGGVDDMLRKAMEATSHAANVTLREAGSRMGRALVDGTPEKDHPQGGLARANWNASKDVEDDSVNEGATHGDVEAKVSANDAVVQGVDFFAGETLVFTNGVEFIGELESGTSPQAPTGIVGPMNAEMPAVIDEIARKVGAADGK